VTRLIEKHALAQHVSGAGADVAGQPVEFSAVVASIAAELDLQPLLERIVEQATRLLGAAGGAISLVGAAVDAPRLLTATFGIPPAVRQRAIPGNQGLMGQVIAARGAVIVDDYGTIDRPLPDPAFHRLGPWVAVPIWRQGEIIGTFGIGMGQQDRQVGPAEVQLLETLAHHASIAIENALLYRESRMLAVSEERNRLAREMHDTVAQTLASLRLEVDALQAHAEAGATLRGRLERLATLAELASDDLRRAIWALQPAPLDRTTLEDALRGELRALADDGISGQVESDGEPRALSPFLRSNLFLIAREALANIRKHAGAERVRITLRYGERELGMTIQDDGRGFDPDSLAAPGLASGFGLYAIQDRVAELGGRVSVASAIDVGARIALAVPYELPLGTTERSITVRPAADARGVAPVRVALIDDHALIREGVRRALEQSSGFEVVGEASNGLDGLRLIDEVRPDIVLLDVRMPVMDGLEVVRRLAGREDAPKVVVLTMAVHDEVVYEMIRAGARGYLLKDSHPDELLQALRTVQDGGSLIAPVAASRLAERLAVAAPLTAREREVLALVEHGLRNKEIAARLGVSEKTVQFHIANVFQKLGVQGRTEAVHVARQRGLLASDE
jgi:DNA-binding NarL/FixJ family response regulator/signal transduction histidine kinase